MIKDEYVQGLIAAYVVYNTVYTLCNMKSVQNEKELLIKTFFLVSYV